MSEDSAVHATPLSDARLLAEVMPAIEQLPLDPSAFPLIYDLAVTCEQSGFLESSLVLYDRCLRLSLNDDDLQTTYANLTAAYHAAAAAEPDPTKRDRHLHDGLYAATAALDPEGAKQVRPTCVALAHRSVLFAEIGHHASAIADAQRVRPLAVANGLHREQVVAAIGEVIARWHGALDTTVLAVIDEINVLAEDLKIDHFLRSVHEIEVDVLWTMGRYDEARVVLQRETDRLYAKLHRHAVDRWEPVRASVDRIRRASDVEADPLTGLPNGRFLGRWLPEVLADDVPVCIAALNLDGFAHLNRGFGPDAGDGVLQELAALLERVCRRGDSVTRIGGDDFVMVLRDASPGDARVVLERVRQLIAARSWSSLPADVHLNASIGATVGSGALNATALQATARDALRHAKALGGDQINFR
ncbi:MAG: GGDEF domain-containing protein [Ilumatobacteraceae bacterium]